MIFQFLKKYRRKKQFYKISLYCSVITVLKAAIIKIIVKYSRFDILPLTFGLGIWKIINCCKYFSKKNQKNLHHYFKKWHLLKSKKFTVLQKWKKIVQKQMRLCYELHMYCQKLKNFEIFFLVLEVALFFCISE